MINVLFWNVGTTKQNVSDEERNARIDLTIQELVIENNIDVAFFCEYLNNLESICNLLSMECEEFNVASLPLDCRIKLIYKSKYYLKLYRDSRYYVIHSLENGSQQFLLSGVHFPSKLHADKRDIELVAGQYIRDLKEVEFDVGHNRSIIVGDFNANPFDEMMLLANYFNSIPYSEIVKEKKERCVYGKKYQMFYNPMWNMIGDVNKVNSTYYLDSGGAIDFYQNIYDQVIISADMVENFDKNGLKIVTATSTNQLIDECYKPDKKVFSDHLPIIFSIKEE